MIVENCLAVRHDFAPDERRPSPISRGLTVPTFVLGAGQDISFPGEKLIERMKATVPNVETELVADRKRSPPTTPEFRHWLADKITRFLGVRP